MYVLFLPRILRHWPTYSVFDRADLPSPSISKPVEASTQGPPRGGTAHALEARAGEGEVGEPAGHMPRIPGLIAGPPILGLAKLPNRLALDPCLLYKNVCCVVSQVWIKTKGFHC